MSHRVVELHNIMPLANIPSVLNRGILSHEQAAKLNTDSIIPQSAQVPRGLKLHQYAKLYFDAHNPALMERKTEALCVLRISTEIFDVEGVVLTDHYSSSPYVRYLSPQQIGHIHFDNVFAENWEDTNEINHLRKKAAKCAEVLVPVSVPFCFISGAYVPDNKSLDLMGNYGFKRELTLNPTLFFV